MAGSHSGDGPELVGFLCDQNTRAIQRIPDRVDRLLACRRIGEDKAVVDDVQSITKQRLRGRIGRYHAPHGIQRKDADPMRAMAVPIPEFIAFASIR
jgi:hypothetical protein